MISSNPSARCYIVWMSASHLRFNSCVYLTCHCSKSIVCRTAMMRSTKHLIRKHASMIREPRCLVTKCIKRRLSHVRNVLTSVCVHLACIPIVHVLSFVFRMEKNETRQIEKRNRILTHPSSLVNQIIIDNKYRFSFLVYLFSLSISCFIFFIFYIYKMLFLNWAKFVERQSIENMD